MLFVCFEYYSVAFIFCMGLTSLNSKQAGLCKQTINDFKDEIGIEFRGAFSNSTNSLKRLSDLSEVNKHVGILY